MNNAAVMNCLSIPALLLTSLIAACGGGDSDATTEVAASPAPDLVSIYVGRWALSCEVMAAPGQDPSSPDGLSGDEVLSITRINEKQYTATRIESIYNNTTCSTNTSYFQGASVLMAGEIVGAKTGSSGTIDLTTLVRADGGGTTKALMQVANTVLYVTRADQANGTLDSNGYPQTLDLTRPFTKIAH